jgi:hypothetical protein
MIIYNIRGMINLELPTGYYGNAVIASDSADHCWEATGPTTR